MSQQEKRKTKRLLDFQARNQLGTPGGGEGAESFLKGEQIFELCEIVSKYVQHFFPVGAKTFLRGFCPPWLRACGLLYITKNKHFLAYFILFSKNRSRKPGSVPASPAANLQYLTASIWQDLSAAWFFVVVNCSDVVMSVFNSPVLTRSLIFLQLWTAVS